MKMSKKLTIFEGPDGSGKTTMAKSLAKETGALYTHLGPFPRVGTGLARLYVEAMLPAVLGYADVVLDRCWLSETPYGEAFREGRDRIGFDRVRLLERLALRCQTRLVLMTPSWLAVKRNFEARKGAEYLEHIDQLRQVYNHYEDMAMSPGFYTSLPVTTVDAFLFPPGTSTVAIGDFGHSFPHPMSMASAGNWHGPVLMVGDSFGPIQDSEPLYQWPFGSLANSGCSLWLARQLSKAGVAENQLLWINADQLDPFTAIRPDLQVVALGKKAAKKLDELGRANYHLQVHPQAWKRFNAAKDYPLIPLLKELVRG